MDKEKLFNMSEEDCKIWNSCSYGMALQNNEFNCFSNPDWNNSLDQSDPFESALSSIVSSPSTSNANNANPISTSGVVISELIGRLGNICNSGDVSPNSFVYNNNNNSTNTSCYTTPLNSPPKMNISMVDSQIKGNLPVLENNVSNHQSLAPFQSHPGFTERAARNSFFGGMNVGGALNPQFGLTESELPPRLIPRESGKLLSNHSMKVVGIQQVNVEENKKNTCNSDKQVSTRPSTPENVEVGDSREVSSVSEQISAGELRVRRQNESNDRKRKAVPRGKPKETPSSSPEAKVSTENDRTSLKKSKSDEEDKAKEEKSGSEKQNKENSKPPEPPKDYIHVRARRGQATDSHSLAERVRREKISERMKFLQDLVPGCNKVTGKAVMLDEIINYVQSLQRQVEFLSMKLATVNPRIDFNMEAVVPKDILQSGGSINHFPLDSAEWYYQSHQGLPLQNGSASICYRIPTFWEDDLQSVVQMGFGQNQPSSTQRSMPTAQMKVEL